MSLIIPNGISGVSLSNDLQAIAGLTGTGVIKRTGDGTAELLSSTATGESVLTAADAAAARTAIGSPGITSGTWTPAYVFGTGSVTYGSQDGRWLKIDNYVWFSLRLSTNGIQSLSGSVRITLPFPLLESISIFVATIGLARGFATDMPNIRAYIQAASLIILRKESTTSSIDSEVTTADFADGTSKNVIYLSGFYEGA